jgi:Arc/MetJ-type ribon-helix-helix transcriptional regulator
MDGERISLRLEPEDLELLDAFIRKHPEYSNRSNFARIALRSFIERVEGTDKTGDVNNEVQDNTIPVRVPRFALNTIMDLVRAGIYNSPEDAVVECVRKRYTLTDEAIDTVMRANLEAHKNTVQVLPE